MVKSNPERRRFPAQLKRQETMNTTAHTPGPWVAGITWANCIQKVYKNPEDEIACVLPRAPGEGQANAALIAAAPETAAERDQLRQINSELMRQLQLLIWKMQDMEEWLKANAETGQAQSVFIHAEDASAVLEKAQAYNLAQIKKGGTL